MAPRASVTELALLSVSPMVEAPGVRDKPATVCELVVAPLPVAASLPPARTRVDPLLMMFEAGEAFRAEGDAYRAVMDQGSRG